VKSDCRGSLKIIEDKMAKSNGEKEGTNYGSVNSSTRSSCSNVAKEGESIPLVSGNKTSNEIGGIPVYESASWVSQLVFGWMAPLLAKGNTKVQLDPSDLKDLPLPHSCTTEHICDAFDHYWEEEMKIAKNTDKDKKKKKKKKKNNGNGNNGRQKGWVYSGKNGQVRINSNEWTDYDDNEIGRGRGDAADKLRSWDACLKNGDYNRNNCLKPPNCGGGEKLCINRAQRSNNDKKSYVKVMKCIPGWENCDKCLCGRIKSTKCDWKGGSPDDDRWKIASCKKKVFELKNNVI